MACQTDIEDGGGRRLAKLLVFGHETAGGVDDFDAFFPRDIVIGLGVAVGRKDDDVASFEVE